MNYFLLFSDYFRTGRHISQLRFFSPKRRPKNIERGLVKVLLLVYHRDKSSSRHYAKSADNSSVAQSSKTPKKLTKTSLSKISAMRLYGRLSQWFDLRNIPS